MSSITLTSQDAATSLTDVGAPRTDWVLVVLAALLSVFGLVMILSASSLDADARYGNALHFAIRQLSGVVGGIVLAVATWCVPTRYFRNVGLPLLVVAGIGLALVLSPLGNEAKGATRWISLGPVNLQPSEFAKLAWIIALGEHLGRNEGRLRKDAIAVGGPIVLGMAVLLAFIFAQKDFGTTAILVGLTGIMLVVAGLQWRWVGAFGGIAVLGLVMMIIVEPYRIQRLTSFVDPFADPDGAGYQVVQGWVALATGGVTGAGLASGVAQRGFLPEAHTDFILAVIGEELGAVGWSAALLVLLAILWRALRIARSAPDLHGMLIAVGIAAMFASQAIINVGVVGGLLPAKGLVLPFLSYGSSAAMVNVWAVGVLLRISAERPIFAAPARATSPGTRTRPSRA
ncbi:MAG: putative lipid II flippase FtsW [Deltaproteobacteria bacterium]|nr:putative lipid II flippase FtsW [Deltaproteobacteria bacterium]